MKCESRITIFTFPVATPLAQKAAHVNAAYAAKHGYTFVMERCPRKEDANKEWMSRGAWSVPALIKRHLQHTDFLVFLNSAVVIRDQTPLLDIIDTSLQNATVIAAAKNKTHSDTRVLILKNNTKTFEILEDWLISPYQGQCQRWQTAADCFEVLRREKHGAFIKLVDLVPRWCMHIDQAQKEITDLFKEPPTTPHKQVDSFTQQSHEASSTSTTTVFATLALTFTFVVAAIALTAMLPHRPRPVLPTAPLQP